MNILGLGVIIDVPIDDGERSLFLLDDVLLLLQFFRHDVLAQGGRLGQQLIVAGQEIAIFVPGAR